MLTPETIQSILTRFEETKETIYTILIHFGVNKKAFYAFLNKNPLERERYQKVRDGVRAWRIRRKIEDLNNRILELALKPQTVIRKKTIYDKSGNILYIAITETTQSLDARALIYILEQLKSKCNYQPCEYDISIQLNDKNHE